MERRREREIEADVDIEKSESVWETVQNFACCAASTFQAICEILKKIMYEYVEKDGRGKRCEGEGRIRGRRGRESGREIARYRGIDGCREAREIERGGERERQSEIDRE